MRYLSFLKTTSLIIGLLIVLSACATLTGSSGESTPTPEPTSSVPDMTVTPSKACQVSKQGMIRVENPQGDLIAWSPVNDTVAYIASTQGSSWNVGELDILAAPKFDTPIRLASQAAGEITWAPDASSIAYLGLRRSDNLYTIGLAYTDGRVSKDLFPDEAARTDDYSSQKSILEWVNPTQLRVFVSCGLNCLQTLEISVLTGLTNSIGDPVERYWGMWAAHTHHPAEIPPELSGLTGQLNWSQDERNIAYIDDNGYVWIINATTGMIYPVDIGQYGTATETDWSYNGKYLAVQVDQNLIIFSFQCP